MGAVCGKPKESTEPKTRKPAVEVALVPDDPSAPQPQSVAAFAVSPAQKPDGKPRDNAKEFVTGEGDGVYLMLVTENNSLSLIQRYAHSKPEVADGDSLLLQIKPPMYVEIKETRFALQNGKRTLKMGIPLALRSPDGQKKVCEAVQECLRLTCAYLAYIHTYPAMASAPFSILLVVAERHEPGTIKDGADGIKLVTGTSVEMPQPSLEGEHAEVTEAPKEEKQKESTESEGTPAKVAGKPAEGDAKEATKGQGKSSPNGKKQKEGLTIFQDPPEVTTEAAAREVLEQVQVLRYLPEGRSPNFSAMRFIIIVPLPKPAAEEALKVGRVIEEGGGVEQLEKQVEELSERKLCALEFTCVVPQVCHTWSITNAGLYAEGQMIRDAYNWH